MMEFNPCICGRKLPFNLRVRGITLILRHLQLLRYDLLIWYATIEALLMQHAQLDFSNVEPTAIAWSVMNL